MTDLIKALDTVDELRTAISEAIMKTDDLKPEPVHSMAVSSIYTLLLDFMIELADQMPHERVMAIQLIRESGRSVLKSEDIN